MHSTHAKTKSFQLAGHVTWNADLPLQGKPSGMSSIMRSISGTTARNVFRGQGWKHPLPEHKDDASCTGAGGIWILKTQYPDPLMESPELQPAYTPELTAIEYPKGGDIKTGDDRYSGTVKCKPITDALKEKYLNAATESSQDACQITKKRGFKVRSPVCVTRYFCVHAK